MSRRGARRARRPRWWRSVRLRAVLGLGVLGCLPATGTFAYWTDDVPITGTTFTSGVLDLQVDGGDSYATTTLGMTGMVPGNSAAEVLTVKNNGTVPLKWTLSGGLGGANASDFATAGALTLKVTAATTVTGSAPSVTCGGTALLTDTPLTTSTSTALIAARQGPVAAGASTTLCFQVGLAAAAPGSLQGKTATATFTFTGTSDVS